MATRRHFLKTGAASAVIIGAGAAGWALSRAPKSAREPWRAAGSSFGDVRLDALAFAILAPNPHNTQPWRIRLEDEDQLTVYCDLDRLLPETDPPNRQITIGFGCFLELLRQAAAEKGVRTIVAPFPEGEPQPRLDYRPIATVRFASDASVKPEPLFAAVIERRTNRAPFNDTRIEQNSLDRILNSGIDGVFASGAIAGPAIDHLKSLARDAWRIEWDLGRTRRESINVTRIGKSEINNAPWGLSLAGPIFDALKIMGVMTRRNMDIPEKAAYRESLLFYERAIESSAGFVWTSTAANTRIDQLNAGAAWVRMNQAAALLGISFHPLSQTLQEFPEMAESYVRAHKMLAHQEGAVVQMLARIGFADSPPPSPREPLTAKLTDE